MEEMVKSGYLIREQIGQGAFGVIYHALDEKNHREAAIKVWKAGSETEQSFSAGRTQSRDRKDL